MTAKKQTDLRRADALRNRERILDAAERMLERSPSATLADIAAAAGVARSTLHRRFPESRRPARRPSGPPAARAASRRPVARCQSDASGRDRPVSLDAIHVFDVVPPAVLPEQLVAEAQRIAQVPVALYVLDIDGSHLLHMAGPRPSRGQARGKAGRSGRSSTPTGLSDLREQLADLPQCTGLRPVAARPRQRSDDRLRSARASRSASSHARRRRRSPSQTATRTCLPWRSAASSRRRPPRSSRACSRRASAESRVGRSRGTCFRATRSRGTGST